MEHSATKVTTRNTVLILVFVGICLSNNVFGKTKQDDDKVKVLPGQPTNPQVSHFSGYITVNEAHGRALFYWFFPSQSDSSNKPLLLWLNGGPGCSSIGYGAAVELGPLLVNNYGDGLHFNEHSWNKEANLLFVESPVGVGFSYTNTSSDLTKLDDTFVAEDAYNFLVNWLERFPEFKNREFFISGESYAGHYVPQLAELVTIRNKDSKKHPYINLKGFIVGNPETDDYYDYKGILEYAWSHSVVSDLEYNKAKQVCDFKVSNWSDACNDAMELVFKKYSEIDIYNIYGPKCLQNSSSSSLANDNGIGQEVSLTEAPHYGFRRMKRIPGGYDPCYTPYTEKYFNRLDVQIALHACVGGRNARVKWQSCSDPMLKKYNYNVFSILPIYKRLIKGGMKIWIFSGDTDGRVPVIGSRYCVEALNLPLKSPWRSWFHKHQKNIPKVELKSRKAKLRIKFSRSLKEKYSKGMFVEVKHDEDGFYGSWHPAVIVKPVGSDKFLVEYKTLKMVNESQSLKEEVGASCIRPCPPEIRWFDPFEHHDKVDAWLIDGWEEGHITNVLGGSNYIVCLTTTKEELVFEHSKLRPHQEWVEEKWVTATKFETARSSPDMTLKSKELKLKIKCSGMTSESMFSKGMRVEVKSDEEGYHGSWYTALIVDSIGPHKFLVEYLTLRTEDESEPLVEKADASDIRPHPPIIQRFDRFKMLEEVDAWYNEGWWVGLICKILDGLKYLVYFWTTNEELVFDHSTLRPRQEWIDGKWFLAFRKKPEVQVKRKLGKLNGQNGGVALHANFSIGAKVEVTSGEEGYQGSWYPAVIVRPLGNGKYMVQYLTLKTENETDMLSEEADALCIRPSPRIIQQTERFRPLEEVDAWYNYGWWNGQVCKVVEGSKYRVYFRTTNEVLEFQHSDLRSHQDWRGGGWVASKRGRIS